MGVTTQPTSPRTEAGQPAGMRDLLRRLLAALRPQRRPARYPDDPWVDGGHIVPDWMVDRLDPMDGVQGPDPRPVQTLGELLRRTR